MHVINEGLINLIPYLVLNENNEVLMRSFTLKEAHEAVFSILIDNSLGTDGFTTGFFINS